jgi:hypothetical protein
MRYHKACKDCVSNHDCLFQNNDDVEMCGDVQDWDVENNTKDEEKDK